jgi:hypothetical protein
MSMNIQGTVVEIAHGVSIEKKDGGSYNGTRFTYRDSKGKVGEQNFHEKTLGYNGLQEALDSLQEKDPFTMVKEKSDSGYWNVKSLEKGHNGDASGSTSGASSTGNSGGNKRSVGNDTYETNDMRRERQRQITKIASVKTAIEFMVASKKNFKLDEVFGIANQIEDFVVDGPNSPADLDLDIE